MASRGLLSSSAVRNCASTEEKVKALIKDGSASYREVARALDISPNKAWRMVNDENPRHTVGRPRLLSAQQDQELIDYMNEKAEKGQACTLLDMRRKVSRGLAICLAPIFFGLKNNLISPQNLLHRRTNCCKSPVEYC